MPTEQFRPAGHEHEHFLLTTVVGSFPQPEWLGRVRELADDGEFDADDLAEANDDAVRAVVNEHERAGIDVLADGEVRRTGMVEHFAQFVDGYELDDDGGSGGWNRNMPSVVDAVSTARPWLVEDYEFAASVSDRPVKTTITGPFTLASFSQLESDDYAGVEELAYAFADLVADEVARLGEAGAPYVQIDEPALGMSPHDDIARECVSRIDDAAPGEMYFGMHVCSGNYENLTPQVFDFPLDFVDLELASDGADDLADIFEGVDLGVDVGVGVVDTQDKAVEEVGTVVDRIAAALEWVPPERLILAPDCGMKPLTRASASGKLRVLGEAAREAEAALDAGEIDHA
ncbi:methionine synthase [Halobacteriales archaeon QS_1_68_17]|nr:MAG: methionine synthase [Halobacteriales archaeon QS_1_68_17]